MLHFTPTGGASCLSIDCLLWIALRVLLYTLTEAKFIRAAFPNHLWKDLNREFLSHAGIILLNAY